MNVVILVALVFKNPKAHLLLFILIFQKGSAPWQVGIATLPDTSDGKIPTITCGGKYIIEWVLLF